MEVTPMKITFIKNDIETAVCEYVKAKFPSLEIVKISTYFDEVHVEMQPRTPSPAFPELEGS